MRIFPFRNALFVLALLCLAAGAARAADQSAPLQEPQPVQQQGQQPPSRMPPPERQDTIMGNIHEGIVMERDPFTGDNIIQVGPPPQPQKNANPQGSPLIVRPEIYLPGGQYGASDRSPGGTGPRR